MYDGAGALVAFDSHRLYRFQAADTASKEKSWIAVYGLVVGFLESSCVILRVHVRFNKKDSL